MSDLGSLRSFPLESTSLIAGLVSFAPTLDEESKITIEDNPVISSIFLSTFTPSSKSTNWTVPLTSVIIGLVWGSHEAIVWPWVTLSPSLTVSIAPYGNLYNSFSLPFSSVTITSADLVMDTYFPSLFLIIFAFLNLIIPSDLTITLLIATDPLAAPPIWNVLIVSCVPGSPIDCAAITPTDSPIFTRWPLARSLP